MRVVHLSSVHVWYDTRIFYRQCRGLSLRGHDITLVAAAPDGVVKQTAVSGVRVQLLPVPRIRLARAVGGTMRVVLQAMRLGGDVAHLHDPELLPWVRLLKQRFACVIYDMHEYLQGAVARKAWIPAPIRSPVSSVAGAIERVVLRGVPVIYAEDSYPGIVPTDSDSAIVRNYPDLSLFDSENGHLDRNLDGFRLVYIGGMSEDRGFTTMLEAVKILWRKGQLVSLDLVGPLDSVQRAKVAATNMETGGAVRAHGRLPLPEAIHVLRSSHAGLCLLADTPNYRVSQPTKLFEYMAAGLPVIASKQSRCSEVVRSAGCGALISFGAPEEVAAVAECWNQDRALLATLSDRSTTAVRARWNWAHELDKLEALYERNLRLRAFQ